MTIDDNGHVGSGWRYRCKSCGHQVGIDTAFPEKCPGCGAGGWWGRLTTENSHSATQEMAPTISPYPEELCHPKTDSDMCGFGQSKGDSRGILTPEKPDGRRGPKFRNLPDDLIMDLAGQGQGAKRIAEVLEGRGIRISSRTINRRLQMIEVKGANYA